MVLKNRNNQKKLGKKVSSFNPQKTLTREKTSKNDKKFNYQTRNQDLILVVHNNPNDLNSLFLSLEQGGLEIIVVQDRKNAIAIAAAIEPGLILLEHVMPDLDGFEICRALKAKTVTDVIFLASSEEVNNQVKGFELGAIDYITKPIKETQAVSARIQHHLKRQKTSQVLAAQNQKLQQKVQELEHLNSLKDDFLKTISHELRGPMSSILLAAETLKKLLFRQSAAQKSPTFAKALQIFQQACQRQKNLIDDLITLCFLDVEANKIVKKSFNLQVLILETIKPFFEIADSRQQQLIIDLDEQITTIDSDSFIVKRILTELLNNACKYTPIGEKILVKAGAIEGLIRIDVTNSGITIPLQEQESIFEQFYRITPQDSYQCDGTGLGLTIVKKMVELLEGSINLESAENLTTFSLAFPKY